MLYALVLAALAGPVEPQFVRGDVNGDDQFTNADVSAILEKVFNGIPVPCDDAADVNNSGTITSLDATYLQNFIYNGGPAPAAPFPNCGEDTGSEALDCDSPPSYCD